MKNVIVIPAGRKRFLELLLPQLPSVDEIQLWCNTDVPDDVEYIHAQASDYIKVIDRDLSKPINPKRIWRTISQFYVHTVDPDAIYVRLDDDIVWMEEGALRKLIDFRIENPSYFVVSANIIGNSICNHLHQRIGAIDTSKGFYRYDAWCPFGWLCADGAYHAHNTFFAHLEAGTTDAYKFGRWELCHERFSTNAVCFFGTDFAQFGGMVEDEEEEEWLSRTYPKQKSLLNCICGNSLMCHYAYHTQREMLDFTPIYQQYRSLSRPSPHAAK